MIRKKAQSHNAYSEERVRRMAQEFAAFEAQAWRAAIEEILDNHRQAPLPAEIRKIVWSHKRKIPKDESAKAVTSCEYCQGVGVFTAIKKVDEIDHGFAFRCYCPAGYHDERAFPRWADRLSATYTPYHRYKMEVPKGQRIRNVPGFSSAAELTQTLTKDAPNAI